MIIRGTSGMMTILDKSEISTIRLVKNNNGREIPKEAAILGRMYVFQKRGKNERKVIFFSITHDRFLPKYTNQTRAEKLNTNPISYSK